MRWHPEECKFMVFLEIVVSEDTICKHNWTKCDFRIQMEPSINLQGSVILVSMVPQLTGNKSASLQLPQNQQMRRRKEKGLLWWSSIKNPHANARSTGSIPGPGRSPCQGATKPVHHNYGTHKPELLKLECSDSAEMQRTAQMSLSTTTMSGPCSPATRELNKAHAQQKDPAWPKINKWIFLLKRRNRWN